ncbi:type I-E CRISPR-associated protein Cse1/CasA [Amycolatopsis mediterranei]|uniref:type I-E CRISPR-associated protein Cse1/CasA n=1 Tax=Amycolatopsis mediterranei TaxID=33910 RepID=UPI00344901A1
MTATFDLTVEPWIPVVHLDEPDSAETLVGLHELFASAHRIRRIVGETPPMTAALYRLALAVLHRAYGPPRLEDWEKLWTAETFDPALLAGYLDRPDLSFDLFDPQRPFLQCPGLPEGKKSTVAKLIPHRAVGNRVTLFDHTTARDRVELTPAAAARWLVTAQAFDPGGMKTPYTTDKSSERAPCNYFGVVLVEGANLKETLLLNAVRYDAQASDDAPTWEAPLPPPEPEKRRSRGWTDVLTWPSRRIRLFPEDSGGATVVAQSVLTPGVRLVGELPEAERMAAYRTPRTPSGKPKPDEPMRPIRLQPVRGVWRHSVELLLVDPWSEERTRQRPRALKQLATLAEHGYVPADTVYTLRVFGQKLDKNASVVEGYLEEEVPAPVALIRAGDDALTGLVGCAIELADEAGAALRAMQWDYYKALHSMRREQQKDVRAKLEKTVDLAYWPALPAPFAALLRTLNDARLAGQSEQRAMAGWRRAVTSVAAQAADSWAAAIAADRRSVNLIGKQQQLFLDRMGRTARTYDAQIAKYLTKDDNE